MKRRMAAEQNQYQYTFLAGSHVGQEIFISRVIVASNDMYGKLNDDKRILIYS